MNTVSARAVREFVRVTERDQFGQVKVVEMPGHGGRRYQVILRRKGCYITAECRQDLGGYGYGDCKGNSNSGSPCYHSLSAVQKAAGEKRLTIAWCKSQADAQRLVNLGGTIICVRSHQGAGEAWGVAR